MKEQRQIIYKKQKAKSKNIFFFYILLLYIPGIPHTRTGRRARTIDRRQNIHTKNSPVYLLKKF